MSLAERYERLRDASTRFNTWIQQEAAARTHPQDLFAKAAATVTRVQDGIPEALDGLRAPRIAIAPPDHPTERQLLNVILPGALNQSPPWLRHFGHPIKRISERDDIPHGMVELRLLPPEEIVKIIVAATQECGPPLPATAEDMGVLRRALAHDNKNAPNQAEASVAENLRKYFSGGDFGKRIAQLTELQFWNFATEEAPHLGNDTRRSLFEFIWGSQCRCGQNKRCIGATPQCELGDLYRGWLFTLERLKHATTVRVRDESLRGRHTNIEVYPESGGAVQVPRRDVLRLTRELLLPWPDASSWKWPHTEVVVFPPCSDGGPSSDHQVLRAELVFLRAKARYLRKHSGFPLSVILTGSTDVADLPSGKVYSEGLPPDDPQSLLITLNREITLESREKRASDPFEQNKGELIGKAEALLQADKSARDELATQQAEIRFACRDARDLDSCNTFVVPTLLSMLDALDLNEDALRAAVKTCLNYTGSSTNSVKAEAIATTAVQAWQVILQQCRNFHGRGIASIAAIMGQHVTGPTVHAAISAAVLPHLPNKSHPSEKEMQRLVSVIQEAARTLLLPSVMGPEGEATAYARTRDHWLEAIAALAHEQSHASPSAILAAPDALSDLKAQIRGI